MSNIKKEILDAIISDGVESSKADILGVNPMEDKVYTKRININDEYSFKNEVNTIDVECVSLTSDTPSFDSVTDEDKVRINMKNAYGTWCNIFINEAPDELVEFIHSKICK